MTGERKPLQGTAPRGPQKSTQNGGNFAFPLLSLSKRGKSTTSDYVFSDAIFYLLGGLYAYKVINNLLIIQEGGARDVFSSVSTGRFGCV